MPVNTIQNVALQFSITQDATPLEFACQVIDATLTLPGPGSGTRIETACPEGAVVEAGTATNGSITGNVFVDTRDTGITWALATLYPTGAEFPYSLSFYVDLGNTIAIKFTGNAIVNTFNLPFSKPGKAKQPIDLGLITAVMARPTAVTRQAA